MKMARFVSFVFPAFLLLAACETANNAGSSNSGLAATFQYTFRNFKSSEIDHITGVMEEQWSGFQNVRGVSGGSRSYKYGYVTTAPGWKQLRWLNIVLSDMGLNPDRSVKVMKQGTRIEINKIY